MKTDHLFEDKICSKEATMRVENGDDDTHSLRPLLFAELVKTFVSAWPGSSNGWEGTTVEDHYPWFRALKGIETHRIFLQERTYFKKLPQMAKAGP